jgi:hypothetical protein
MVASAAMVQSDIWHELEQIFKEEEIPELVTNYTLFIMSCISRDQQEGKCTKKWDALVPRDCESCYVDELQDLFSAEQWCAYAEVIFPEIYNIGPQPLWRYLRERKADESLTLNIAKHWFERKGGAHLKSECSTLTSPRSY